MLQVKLDWLLESFKKYDVDKTGNIAVDELRDLVADLVSNSMVTSTTADKMISMDTNQDQSVSFSEFIAFATGHHIADIDRICANFCTFPTNRATGRVPVQLVQRRLAHMCVVNKIPIERFDAIAELVNHNRDGTVSFEEYVAICQIPEFAKIDVLGSGVGETRPRISTSTSTLKSSPVDAYLSSEAWVQAKSRSVLPRYFVFPGDNGWEIITTKPTENMIKPITGEIAETMKYDGGDIVMVGPGYGVLQPPYPCTVLFVHCSFSDNVIHLFEVQGHGKLLERRVHTVHHNPLLAVLSAVRLLHVPSDCVEALKTWVHDVVLSVPFSNEVSQAHHVIVSIPKTFFDLEPRLRNPLVQKVLGHSMHEVLKSKIAFKCLVSLRTILLTIHSEARAEMEAARFFAPDLSSVISMDSTKCKASSISDSVILSSVGTKTESTLKIPLHKLWETKLLQPVRNFGFGEAPLFLGAFVYAGAAMAKFFQLRRYSQELKLMQEALELPGLPIQKMKQLMVSKPVQEFIDLPEAKFVVNKLDPRTQPAAYYLQQIIVCGDFSPQATILLKSRFKTESGMEMPATFCLGWLLMNKVDEVPEHP
jgi:Ca2+-binding EF-hand superfamily protein